MPPIPDGYRILVAPLLGLALFLVWCAVLWVAGWLGFALIPAHYATAAETSAAVAGVWWLFREGT